MGEAAVFSQPQRSLREVWPVALIVSVPSIAAVVTFLVGLRGPSVLFFVMAVALGLLLVAGSRPLRIDIDPATVRFSSNERTRLTLERDEVEHLAVARVRGTRGVLVIRRRTGGERRQTLGTFDLSEVAAALRSARWPVDEEDERRRRPPRA